MATCFDRMMNDLFNVQDFLETCTINDMTYFCVCSKIDQSEAFTTSGLENEASFTLDFKRSDNVPLAINVKITFRGVTYKVEKLEPDSANASIKAYLLDLSQR